MKIKIDFKLFHHVSLACKDLLWLHLGKHQNISMNLKHYTKWEMVYPTPSLLKQLKAFAPFQSCSKFSHLTFALFFFFFNSFLSLLLNLSAHHLLLLSSSSPSSIASCPFSSSAATATCQTLPVPDAEPYWQAHTPAVV